MKKGINMKMTIVVFLVLIAELFAPRYIRAQDTLYVSNLEQAPDGGMSVGSDSWYAQPFLTGTDSGGYMLNSVQLLMDGASGNPNGFLVSIYKNSGNSPQNNVGNLNGSDPSAGIFTYAASDIVLLPSSYYFVVVTAATPVVQGAYNWSATESQDLIQNGNWSIPVIYDSSSDGSSWTEHGRQDIFQMAIYATPIPEPATGALFGIGVAFLSFLRRKSRQGQSI